MSKGITILGFAGGLPTTPPLRSLRKSHQDGVGEEVSQGGAEIADNCGETGAGKRMTRTWGPAAAGARKPGSPLSKPRPLGRWGGAAVSLRLRPPCLERRK